MKKYSIVILIVLVVLICSVNCHAQKHELSEKELVLIASLCDSFCSSEFPNLSDSLGNLIFDKKGFVNNSEWYQFWTLEIADTMIKKTGLVIGVDDPSSKDSLDWYIICSDERGNTVGILNVSFEKHKTIYSYVSLINDKEIVPAITFYY